MKNLNVAIQMDNIENIDLEFDTSFLIGLEAQNRKYKLFYYNPIDLEYLEGNICANGYFIELHDNKKDYFRYLSIDKSLQILNNFDVILIRQDPPFNMNYITSTYLLEKLTNSTVVINNPTSVRNFSEKIFPLKFKKFIPPTSITQNISTIKQFLEKHKDIVTKPLYGNGGEGIFRTKITDKKLQGIREDKLFLEEPIVIQKYIPEIINGDRRIILIDGEYYGSVARIPEENNLKANFHAGGKPQKSDLIYRDKEICEALKENLKKYNLFFVGIDTIGNYLTEINVTSPTGFKQINELNNIKLERIFWDKLVSKYF